MAADVQAPLLTVSALPSMLMNYLTGPGNNDSSSHAITEQKPNNHRQNHSPKALSSSPTTPRRQLSLNNTPQSSRSNPNRISLPLMLGDTLTDDGDISREGSLMSANGQHRKRLSFRPKTSYSINHAPPKGSARHKIHVRARPLLQLHRLHVSSRPMPAFELLPSAIFSPSLSRAISKAFRTKHGSCPADLAIVKADDYHQHEEAGKDEDESRDVLALVCKGRKGDGNGGKSKLLLDDGSEWETSSLPNGGYEFVSTDEHGLSTTVRWVLRRPRARRSQSASDMTASLSTDPSPSKKFCFSTIAPTSRRHPVIATLNSASLEINDTYTVPSAISPSRGVSPSSDNGTGRRQSAEQEIAEPMDTSQILKTLITATAVWVTLREGWCPGYRFDDGMMRSPSLKSNTPTKSQMDALKNEAPRRSTSIRALLRPSSALKRRSTASAFVDGSLDEPSISRNSSVSNVPARRPRAESASTVIIHTKRPRGRRANTTSTTASSIHAALDLAHNDMTEEEETVEQVSTVPKYGTVKRSSAPTPTISPLSSDSEKEHESSTAASSPIPPQKRVSSATVSTNMSIKPKRVEADDSPVKQRRGRRLSRLFCGMAG